jgi:tetratricopeptide (TPR) repeat protein
VAGPFPSSSRDAILGPVIVFPQELEMGLFDRFLAPKRATGAASHRAAGDSEEEALRLIDAGNAIEQEGRIAEALQHYETAVKLAPNLARAHLNRGNMLLEMGDADGAIAAYTTALEKDPDYAAAPLQHR